MKGQAKRLVDHKGQEYPTDTGMIDPPVKDRNASIGFFDLWRYSTLTERLVTVLGVLLSWCCSCGVISAVVVYGEITAMFVARHKAESADNQVRILKLFGGGRVIPDGDRPLHMDALVEDSIAFAWASVAVMLLQFSAAAASVTLSSWAAKRTCERLRWRLLEAVLRQESAFFDTNTSMNFATTLTEDMEKFRAGVGEHVSMTAYLGGSVVCGVATALVYGWQLALVGLAFVPVAVVVAVVVAKYQTKSSAAEVGAYSKAGRTVEEALANIRTVRAYAGEAVEVKRYSEALIPAAFASLRRGIWAGLGAGLGWLLTYAMIAAVFAYGAALCARDLDLPVDMRAYNPAVMITVLFCTFMSAQNVAMCHPHLEIFSNARGAARSLYRLLERKSLIDALGDQGTRPDRFRGDIEFDNLYFNYPSRPDVKVLRGLTLSIRAGETVALVGGSGCGKSTLLQLLQRMYEPDSGSVTVDGVRLEDLNIHHYRTSIGVVGQEPVLFAGSIRDNITIGLTDVPENDVIEAAKTAHAHQFITKLADGYNTMLGERGAQLSGGQKQRIAIARAVLRRPAILLLDEPTSALDPHAERQVQAALDAAARGRTTLTVSHRLSTIVNASRIVYMEQGAALEQGSHDELMAKKGLYWKLVQEDLTNKSITNALAAPAESEEADDQVPPTPEPRKDPFRRSISRASVLSASLSRESAVRSSRRLGSVSSAHLRQNLPAPDSIPEEEEGDEKVPPVSLLQILRLNRAEWPLLAGGGASSFLIGGTMPLFALFFSKLYGMLSSSDKDEIIRESRIYAGLFGAVAALCGLVTFLQAWLFNRAGAKLTDRLRVDTFTNYLKQEQGWFDRTQNSVGALCARLASDAAAVQGATGTPLGTVLQGVSTMVIGVGLAMPYSWKMTLVSLLSVPCVIGGIWLEGVVTRRAEDNERRALEHASRVATEAVLNVKTVHSLGVESTILSRYRSALASARARTGRMAGVRGAVYGLCLCAPTLGYAVSLAYGGYLIAREGLSYEYAILVSEALIYGAWMLAEALSFAPSFAAARRAAARVLAALRRQPAIVTEDTAVFDPTWSASGDLEFSHLDFSYPSRPSAAVLRGLTLTVRRGQSVALVGASGCGKSTLMHLLMRSYDPSNGTVKMDGVDIKRSLTLPQLRAQLGLVAQEPALFERSIRDNIAYGDTSRHVSTEEVIKAATQANVHQFISSLPLGYETRLGAGGAALSGGQKQRVAIARALVRDPRVLLLDEATSALDANSEKTVQAALEAASKDRTTIIIAHRLATVQHADVICVIDRGVVAESGSHEELVRKRGLYWELLQQQAPTS